MKEAIIPSTCNKYGVWKAYWKGRVVASSTSKEAVIRIAILRGFSVKELT